MFNQLSAINSTKATLKRSLGVVLSCMWILGCGGCSEEKIYVSKEIRKYEVVSIHPPKHFNVDLLDVETHRLFKGQGWSKHCSSWKRARLGEIVDVETYTFKYKDSDTEYQELRGVREYFCN